MLVSVVHYGLLVALAIALLVAATTDIRHRRIDNSLNAAIAAAAPLFWWSSDMAIWPDIAIQIGFTLAVSAVLIGLYALRTIGGGDIKLLAALALWITPGAFLELLIIMALAGGLLTIGMVAHRALKKEPHKLVIPYGVAIALGGWWVLGSQHFSTLTSSGLVS